MSTDPDRTAADPQPAAGTAATGRAGTGTAATETAATETAATGTAAAAMPQRHRTVTIGRTGSLRIPAVLELSAGWTWRLLVLAAGAYALVWFLGRLGLIVVPFLTALLITGLLHPIVGLLRNRLHVPRALATWVTIIVAFAVLAAVGFFVANQVRADIPQLSTQAQQLINKGSQLLNHLHLQNGALEQIRNRALNLLRQHSQQIVSGALNFGTTAGELVTGVILCFFITFFLLYDGDRIWDWIIGLFPVSSEARMRAVGGRMWQTTSGYIVGVFVIACFHGTVIGVTLAFLGVSLVVPLAVLVFIGSFIPIVGAVIFGGLAVLVTFISNGIVPAIVVLIVLIVENQVEAHLLQPLVVGRYVRLHPLAIAIALTGGGLLAGLPGAIFAIPVVAAINAAAKLLAGREDAEGNQLRETAPPADASPATGPPDESEDGAGGPPGS